MEIEAALERERLSFFARYIETELGIVFSEDNAFQLRSRLEDVAKRLGIANVTELHEKAKAGVSHEMRTLLLDFATNNETSFFRDPKLFKAIETGILEPFSAESPGKTFKIWSAASSTGQEALSVAITIEEFNERAKSKVSYTLHATDVCDRVLARASTAEYSQLEVDRGLSPERLSRWFTRTPEARFRANPAIRMNLKFDRLNLLDPFAFQQSFNLVLCRNVLIYQNVERKGQIVEKIARIMVPGSYLILGSGESLIGLSDKFERKVVDGVSLYRRI